MKVSDNVQFTIFPDWQTGAKVKVHEGALLFPGRFGVVQAPSAVLPDSYHVLLDGGKLAVFHTLDLLVDLR